MTEPSVARLVAHHIRYQNRLFWRAPIGAFFTIALPLIMLVLFDAIFDGDVEIGGRGPVSITQFYTPALAAFAAASATYTNLGTGLAIYREDGVLKRFRSTPLPPWVYIAGAIGSGVWIAAIANAIMIGIAVVGFDVSLPADRIPAAAVAFGFGVFAFAALGVALASLAPSGGAAPAMANATILPLSFISNVFIPLEDPPAWLDTVGDIFPLKHFVEAFLAPFDPTSTGSGFEWGDLAVVAVWGVLGAVVAVRSFRWQPTVGKARSGRRSRTGARSAR
ncbi:MAG: ABC transporter permease [Acidimicrobiales bacterium]